MEQKSITDYQIHRAHIQLKKSPELDVGRVLQESMLRILAVCLLFFFLFPGVLPFIFTNTAYVYLQQDQKTIHKGLRQATLMKAPV